MGVKEDQKAVDWTQLLNSREQVLSAPSIEKSLAYLRSARTPGLGWGAYPKAGSDLYHSAVVIQALSQAGDCSSLAQIADVAAYWRSKSLTPTETLGLVDVCNLLTIARCERKPFDDSHIVDLLDRLRAAYEGASARMAISLRDLAFALISVFDSGWKDFSFVPEWTETLVKTQSPDGGWPAVTGDSSSLVVSTFGVRALRRALTEQAREAVARGIAFLQGTLASRGWQGLGGTFSQALVLLTLAESLEQPSNEVMKGVESVTMRRNGDGSWGGEQGEPGNTEVTSLCVMSLVEAGETKFVPALLAKAALSDMARRVTELSNEGSALRSEFDKRVQEHCGLVVRERDELLKTREELNKKLRDARARARLIPPDFMRDDSARDDSVRDVIFHEREFFEVRQSAAVRQMLRARQAVAWLTLLTLMGSAGLSAWFLLRQPLQTGRYNVVGAVISFMSTLALAVIVSIQLRATRLGPRMTDLSLSLPQNISGLRSLYNRIAEDFPSSIREELAYRLFTELGDMPPDIGIRYAEELASRLGIPGSQRTMFLSWVRQVMRLGRTERRLLVSQLEKTYLR